VRARFAPHPIRDYWREWAVALLFLAMGVVACWWMWLRLPSQAPAPGVTKGIIQAIQPGLPSGGKYTAVHGRIAVLDVVLPGGGVQRFTGDGQLLARCRRGDPVGLMRYGSAWVVRADSCGGPRR
jgi:hypothetical protein